MFINICWKALRDRWVFMAEKSSVGPSGHIRAANPMQFNEATYHSLLVLAENYRLAKPPRIRPCLHCLMAVFSLNPPPPVQIRIHLQLGLLLIQYTENKQLARSHLQAAVSLSKSTGNILAYFEAVSLLAKVLCELSKPAEAKPYLREGIAASQHMVYWHARLLLQLAHIHHQEGDHTSTIQLLDVGAELANNCGSDYLKILFLLSKGMVLLVQQKLEEVNIVLSMCGQLIDGIKNATTMQIESHKVYFLTLQVAHLLQGGQVKSVKSSLKQLQQSIQEITALPASSCSLIPPESRILELHEVDDMMKKITSSDGFTWLPRDHMCILVYLVTVTYSLLAGYLDKAQKYTDKALKQIHKLKATDPSPLLVQLELMFLEHLAQCHLITCDKKAALQQITDGCRLCVTYPNTPSIARHTTQMHTLLGMYCMSMNYLDDAEKHLQVAMKGSRNNEQLATNMLNLALVYMHNFQLNNGRIPQIKQQELLQILTQINPDTVALKSRNLKAASFYVKGMFAFFQSIHSDAKRYLRETLKMANAQDLNRLTACALVLLGHIYLSVGNNQESVNMVLPAMQLANKIPDTSVKLWASALLRDLYRLCGDEEHFTEYKKMYEKLASRLLSEQYAASESSQHDLIKWFSDELPPVKIIDVNEATGGSGGADSSTAMDTSTTDAPIIWGKDEMGTSGAVGSIHTKSNNILPATVSRSEIRHSKQGASAGLSSNINQTLLSQTGNRSSSSMVDVDMHATNAFYPINNDTASHANRGEISPKFHPALGIAQSSEQSQLLSSVNKEPMKRQHSRPLGSYPSVNENQALQLPNQKQHGLSQMGMVMDNAMPSQQNNSFVSPVHQPQIPDSLKTTQTANLAKVLGAEPTYLTGMGVQPLPSNFANIVQHNPQLQALQQMQVGHSGDFQNMYHHGGSVLFNSQSVGYHHSNDKSQTEMPEQSWTPNQNHAYNINNGSYTWR